MVEGQPKNVEQETKVVRASLVNSQNGEKISVTDGKIASIDALQKTKAEKLNYRDL